MAMPVYTARKEGKAELSKLLRMEPVSFVIKKAPQIKVFWKN